MKVKVEVSNYEIGAYLIEASCRVLKDLGYETNESSLKANLTEVGSPTVTIYGNIVRSTDLLLITKRINKEYRKIRNEGRDCVVRFAG